MIAPELLENGNEVFESLAKRLTPLELRLFVVWGEIFASIGQCDISPELRSDLTEGFGMALEIYAELSHDINIERVLASIHSMNEALQRDFIEGYLREDMV